MYHKFFAEKIIEELERKRLAKSDLVRASGMNRGYLEQILAGTSSPTLNTMSIIADALELPLSVLLDLPEKRQLGCDKGYHREFIIKKDVPVKAQSKNELIQKQLEEVIDQNSFVIQELRELKEIIVAKRKTRAPRKPKEPKPS